MDLGLWRRICYLLPELVASSEYGRAELRMVETGMKTGELVRPWPSALLLSFLALAVGCAEPVTKPVAPVAALCAREPVTRNGSPIVAKLESLDAEDANASAVWVTWGGEAIPVYVGMWLKRGDVVSTGRGAKVVLTFLEEGAEVLLLSDSRVEVGSLFTWFGSLFVSGRLDTGTKYANGAVNGTKYHVSVDKSSSQATFSVLEGKVTVSPVVTKLVDGHTQVIPSPADWKPFALLPRQRASVVKGQTGAPVLSSIPAADVRTWRERVQTVPGVGQKLAAALTELPVAAVHEASTVSDYVYMPDLTGSSWAAARESLKQVGLRLDAASAAVPESATLRIVSQNPLPRTVVARDSAVCVVALERAAPALEASKRLHSCVDWQNADGGKN